MTEKEDIGMSFLSKKELGLSVEDIEEGSVLIRRCHVNDQNIPEEGAGIPAYAVIISRLGSGPIQILGLLLSEREMEHLKVQLDRFLQSHDDGEDD